MAAHIAGRVQPGEYEGKPVWIYQGYDGIHIFPRRTAAEAYADGQITD